MPARRESSSAARCADDPTPQQFYRAGTIGMIMRMRKLSEGGLKVLVQGLCRARIQRFVSDSPCYRVRLERTEDKVLGRSLNVEALRVACDFEHCAKIAQQRVAGANLERCRGIVPHMKYRLTRLQRHVAWIGPIERHPRSLAASQLSVK